MRVQGPVLLPESGQGEPRAGQGGDHPLVHQRIQSWDHQLLQFVVLGKLKIHSIFIFSFNPVVKEFKRTLIVG